MPVMSAQDLLAGASLTHRVSVPAALLTGGDHAIPRDHAIPEEADEVELRPLVLADIARLNRAAGVDGDLASALMISQALVSPSLTPAQVHQLPAGLVEFLLGEVNRVSGLSLSGDDLSAAGHAPLARACLVLGREFGWTPEKCAELTVGQVLLYLEMLGRGS